MNSDELKTMQAPFKERYQEQPEAAVVTLRAEGQLGDDLSCSVQTGRALVEAGLIQLRAAMGLRLVRETCCSRHSPLVQGSRCGQWLLRLGSGPSARLERKVTWTFEGRWAWTSLLRLDSRIFVCLSIFRVTRPGAARYAAAPNRAVLRGTPDAGE